MIGHKVPAQLNLNSRVLLVGEGPGKMESLEGVPFVGPSGLELDWLYLKRAAKIRREDVSVTNLVKWRTDEKDSDPTAEDIARDEPELLAEIEMLQPHTIVAIGKIAAQWMMMGAVDMEKYFGVPVQCPRYPDKTLVVSYHPAAALRLPERYLDKIYWTFEQVGKVVRGEIKPEGPKYSPVVQLVDPSTVVSVGEPLSIDTEGSEQNPWGMSFSWDPQYGYVSKPNSIPLAGRKLEGHNWLHDARVLRAMGQDVDLSAVDDSMLMAFLLPWLPRALKPLMFKLCRMEQKDYEEVIAPAEEKSAAEYLHKVLENKCRACGGVGTVPVPYKRQPSRFKQVRCEVCLGDTTGWPAPSRQLVFNHDYSAKLYKPQGVGRRVRTLLERGTGLRTGWASVDDEVRNHIEGAIGPMKEPTLDDIPEKDAVHYSGIDACGTRAVCAELIPTLKKEGLWRVYEIDKGILPIIDRMHTNGILIDRDHFTALGKQFAEEQMECIDKLSSIAGFTFNPSSPIQVGELLYSKFGLKVPRNQWSTDEKTLEALKIRYKDREPVVQSIDLITDFRELTKLKGTYVEPLPLAADSAGRVHTQFLLHVANTGRLTSRNPNLQNQPTKTERGRLIRKGFIAKPGCRLASVDLDQIELRVAAHLSEDENLIEVFRTGQDIHRSTASLIYGKPMEEISGTERLLSKTINFLILYGGSAKRLMKELNLLGITVTLDQCVSYINNWFKAYPGVQDYMARMEEQALAVNYVECLFGRRRYVPGVHSVIDKTREESIRWATNFPIQATAAGILKIWLRRIWDSILPTMARYGYCEPLLTVHDEVIFEVEEGLDELLIPLVVAEAAQAVDLLVPISAKGVSGTDWSQLKDK